MNNFMVLLLLLCVNLFAEPCRAIPPLRSVAILDAAVCTMKQVLSERKTYRLVLDEKSRSELNDVQKQRIDSCLNEANTGIQDGSIKGIDTLRLAVQRDAAGFLSNDVCDLYLTFSSVYCKIGNDSSFVLEDCSIITARRAR